VKNVLVISIILVASIILSAPLAKPGLYTIHDDQQVARLFVLDEALRAGQFPVRWVDQLGFGFGYPLFVFYPPLVYAIGELFHLVGFGFIESIKIVFFLSIFLSGISMYVLSKSLFGKLAGLIGATFYIFVPYRALDVYVRGALAESFAFVWPPLIIWTTLRIFKKPTLTNALLLSGFLSGLMLTHNLILLPFILIFLLMSFYLLSISNNKKSFAIYMLFGVIVSALLTTFFWLPAIFEKQFTIVDELLIVNLADFKKHFVYPAQLWNWTWGFGGSSEGLLDGISFKIGKVHILASIASFVVALFLLIKIKSAPKEQVFKLRAIVLFFGLFCFSAFMTTYYSQFIWELIQPLAYLQFPWRFLTFTALFGSILASAFIYLLKVPTLKLIVSILMLLALILPNIKLFKPQYYRESTTDIHMTSSDVIKWDVSLSSFEYSPKGTELVKNSLGANIINISKDDIPKSKLSVSSGQARISILEDKPHRIKFIADVKEDAALTANIFDFPTWELTINGKKRKFSSDNKFKLVTFNLEKGNHTGYLQFKNTPLRNIANSISTISFLMLIVYLSKQWLIHKRK